MTTAQATAKRGSPNGKAADNPQDSLAQAMLSEQEIACEAAAIRGEQVYLDAALFTKLLPLLRRPIPQGFIKTTPPTEGKPYPSTGIKSLQVQVDRLDNVLGPINWSWETVWSEEGKLAHVTVTVWGDAAGEREVLVSRTARGGVNRGSGMGNLYKGSETNAAKLAFARLGVGHEVYLGATDFDPDVDEEAAAEQSKGPKDAPPIETVEADRALHLRELFDESGLKARDLQIKLGALGVTQAKTVNEGLSALTPAQADELEAWFKEQASATKGGDAE